MITGDKLRTLGNVIAFEQCHCMEHNYLNDYVSIMVVLRTLQRMWSCLLSLEFLKLRVPPAWCHLWLPNLPLRLFSLSIDSVTRLFVKSWTTSADRPETNGRQNWDKIISTHLGHLFLSLPLLFSSHSLSYKRCALLSLLLNH